MARVAGILAAMLLVVGCGGRKSSLLLERRARGPLAEYPGVSIGRDWQLEPATQTQEQGQVAVTSTFASRHFLKEFFDNTQVFGPYAGKTPFFPENIVFYVKISNKSQQRIRIDPADFVLLDDRGNQYSPLNVDYVSALEEAHAPVSTVTRGMLSEARPGYFGIGLPVGKLFGGKSQDRFALIKLSSLQAGYLYPGVTHDGLLSFWSPSSSAANIRLNISNVKTDFEPHDWPKTSHDFPFAFRVLNAPETP